MRVDTIWRRARLATMAEGEAGVEGQPGLGIIERGAIAAVGGRIVYCGPESEMPACEASESIDCDGHWITPGLIDCHTHLVFGGDRIDEFWLRLAGARYEELASVGGIRATVAATRAASAEALTGAALVRLDALMAEGVTTVEVKSGYGLDEETELRQLAAARTLAQHRPIHVLPSYLGAHAVPAEFAGRADDYIDWVCTRMIPLIAGGHLADSVDGFCEGIAFSPLQIDRVFQAARSHGLAVRLHADQLSNLGGAVLAASHGALSADHLEYTSEAGAFAMARAGTVAVLLPGAFYTLQEKQRPPVEAFRRHGTHMAVATDLNPGSSPLASPLLAMNMAATLFGLTIEECLLGMTREAARALGRFGRIGSLEAGKQCDLAIWSIGQPAELVYWLGLNPLHQRVWQGK